MIAFFRANVLSSGGYVHGAWGTLLILLTMTIGWVLLVSALVWYGDWKGAERSTRVSFPLQVLLNDLEDLAG